MHDGDDGENEQEEGEEEWEEEESEWEDFEPAEKTANGTGKSKAKASWDDVSRRSKAEKGRVTQWDAAKWRGTIIPKDGGKAVEFTINAVTTFSEDEHAYNFHTANSSMLKDVVVKYKSTLMGGRSVAKWVHITDSKWWAACQSWDDGDANGDWEGWEDGADDGAQKKGKHEAQKKDKRTVPASEEAGPAERKKARASEESEPTSVAEWIKAQARIFGHMSPLPQNWIRIRSKGSGTIYFYNTLTGDSQNVQPAG